MSSEMWICVEPVRFFNREYPKGALFPDDYYRGLRVMQAPPALKWYGGELQMLIDAGMLRRAEDLPEFAEQATRLRVLEAEVVRLRALCVEHGLVPRVPSPRQVRLDG